MTAVHPADLGVLSDPSASAELRAAKVLLVNMPLRESALPNCAPLGPALLAGRLEAAGAEVSLLDLNAYRVRDAAAATRGLPHGRHLSHEEAEALLLRHVMHHGAPTMVGLSGKITTLRWQQAVAKMAARHLPHALLVSGGGLATEFREGLFQWIPELDGVAHSEGDDVILKAAVDSVVVRRRGRLRAVFSGRLEPYLLDRTGPLVHGGKHCLRLVYAGDRPRDLDALPRPAWHLLAKDVDGVAVLEQYLRNEVWGLRANNSSATPFQMGRSLNTVSSRGCPFACSFCFRGSTGERNYGVRSAQSLAQEARWLVDKYRVDFLAVLDDNAMVRADRLEALVPTLGAICQKTGLRWGTHGRLDEAADMRTDGSTPSRLRVQAMAEAGCVYIGFGAESASPATLTAMNKGGHMLTHGTERVFGHDLPVTMLRGYKHTVEAGIHGNTTWILGYPGEDLRALQDSLAFIEWQKTLVDNPAAVNTKMFVATAYPGTEMFRHPAVQARLERGFGLRFDSFGQPVCDPALEAYVAELDDATKVLTDRHGEPVYYGAMPLAQFERVREAVDAGRGAEVLAW